MHRAIPRSAKTKDGFNDQLDKIKGEFEVVKNTMEELYSKCHSVADKDLTMVQQTEIEEAMQSCDRLSTAFAGSLKPMKMSLESWNE